MTPMREAWVNGVAIRRIPVPVGRWCRGNDTAGGQFGPRVGDVVVVGVVVQDGGVLVDRGRGDLDVDDARRRVLCRQRRGQCGCR